MQDENLIGSIYEAAAMPERWPALLEAISLEIGARGGTIGRHGKGDDQFVHSPSLAGLAERWIAGGWHIKNERTAPIWKRDHAGFLTDLDLHSADERARLAVYTDFLVPEKAALGAGTVIQSTPDEGLVLTIEMFRNEEMLEKGVRELDRLRPHLARSVLLSAQFQLQRVHAAVDAIEQAGAAAAMLGRNGQVIAANASFMATLGSLLFEGRDRLRCAHTRSDAHLASAINTMTNAGGGASVAVRDADGVGVGALHLVPVRGDARDVFVGASALALFSDPSSRLLPNADLIQALFDLTPTEAQVARAVASGRSLEMISRQMGKSIETTRSHLKRVYSKTATGRQNELTTLLIGFARAIA